MSLGVQTFALTGIAVRGLRRRLVPATAAALSVALVSLVLLALLAMGSGFRATLDATGSDGTALVLRDGATNEISSGLSPQQIDGLQRAPQIVGPTGLKLLSEEIYVVVDAPAGNGTSPASVSLRGVGPNALEVRDNIAITAGRRPRPGTNELMAGIGLTREYPGFAIGRHMRIGDRDWQVVGLFEAGGSVVESELWGDIASIRSQFDLQNRVQSVRARLANDAAIDELNAFLSSQPGLNIKAQSERVYFSEQSRGISDIIFYLAWPLACTMSIGALAAVLNTMFHITRSKAAEIATLRAMGFGSWPNFFALLSEALVIVLAGYVFAIGMALWLFESLTASTLGGNFTQIVFKFSITFGDALACLGLVLVIGILGGAIPAWQITRRPIVALLGAN
jgi:putative ABC transport system permease protein